MSGNSSSLSRKSCKSSNDSSPSANSTNKQGQEKLNEKLRSVLAHPLGLPLTCMLHGKDLSDWSHLTQESRFYSSTQTEIQNEAFAQLDSILSDSVKEWPAKDGKKFRELELTKLLSEKIDKQFETLQFHSAAESQIDCSDGSVKIRRPASMDIVFTAHEGSKGETAERESTPLAVLEVGRHNGSWWQKLDQCMEYINHMDSDRNHASWRYEKPVLCIALTIENNLEATEAADAEWESKIGVFLCDRATNRDRMMLLRHFHASTLDEASSAFGKVLRATSDFSRWRKREYEDGYEYFGPNCYRVKEYVLRSYDSRFRPTHRSPEIYLDDKCQDILGGKVKRVLEIPSLPENVSFTSVASGDSSSTSSARHHDTIMCEHFRNKTFWQNGSTDRGLLVIATPYRPGGHKAKKPTSFVPVIEQLEQLHNEGFVHGDIRGFNIVYNETDEEGWLIDFDFGGKPGERKYPEGYRKVLADGFRRGDETGTGVILKWHDWYALGRYIFDCHRWQPKDMHELEAWVEQAKTALFWNRIQKDPTTEEIQQLKVFLRKLDELGWIVSPQDEFSDELDKSTPKTHTNPGATGSPLKK